MGLALAIADAISGSSAGVDSGSGALQNPAQTLAGTGGVIVPGTGALLDPAQTLAGTGGIIIPGTGALSNAAQTLAGTGGVIIPGTGALVDPAQTLAGTGGLGAPPGISALGLWLRPDLGFTSTTTVTWADQSGNGNNVTSATTTNIAQGSTGPNGTQGVTLTTAGSPPALTGTGRPVNGSAFSIYLVMKFSTHPGIGTFSPFVLGTSTPVKQGENSTPNRLFTLGGNTQTGGAAGTLFEAWSYIAQSGGTQALEVNGSTVSLSGNIAAVTPDANITLTASSGVSIVFAEVIVYNKALSGSEDASVLSYLRTRYALW